MRRNCLMLTREQARLTRPDYIAPSEVERCPDGAATQRPTDSRDGYLRSPGVKFGASWTGAAGTPSGMRT